MMDVNAVGCCCRCCRHGHCIAPTIVLPNQDAATAMVVAVGGPRPPTPARQCCGGSRLLVKLARDMDSQVSKVIWGGTQIVGGTRIMLLAK